MAKCPEETAAYVAGTMVPRLEAEAGALEAGDEALGESAFFYGAVKLGVVARAAPALLGPSAARITACLAGHWARIAADRRRLYADALRALASVLYPSPITT